MGVPEEKEIEKGTESTFNKIAKNFPRLRKDIRVAKTEGNRNL
jgi:hypothetical protein